MSGLGRQLYGIADFRCGTNHLARKAMNGTCLVDGVSIALVSYVDTEGGIVETYDLRGIEGLPEGLKDGKVHPTHDLNRFGFSGALPENIEAPTGGVICRTMLGKVELFAKAESE
jgi:hypothetical protein